MGRRRLRTTGVLLAAWTVVALPAAVLLFASSSEETSVAGHDAVVSATFDGYATLDLGPYLPNLRYPSGARMGADIRLGKTNLPSYEALVERYAAIGTRPDGEIAKIRGAITALALDSAVTGALVGLAGPGLWLLLGRRRRTELTGHVTPGRVSAVLMATAVAVVAVVQPWARQDPALAQDTAWQPLGSAISGVAIPTQAEPLEIESGLITSGTRRLVESALDSYGKGLAFYEALVEHLPEVAEQIRQPEEGETVAVMVSDRHDNIGMDRVARAIGDAGGASILLGGGDDTSTGSPWEAFSLDSLHEAFSDYDSRYVVAGNHDHGDFVVTYFDKLGFTTFDGEPVVGPDDIRILGADDPRSSGLGSWRDQTGLSFGEHADRVGDLLCEYDEKDERVATLLTHDANTGREALARGCVDLVVGGHVHEQLGPTQVAGENGQRGYSFTMGTTGGAAYAVAIGSKIRRNAMVTLITYRDGRPIGLQPITIRTVGDFRVGEFTELALLPRPGEEGEATPAPGEEGTEEAGDPDEGGTANDPSGEESP